MIFKQFRRFLILMGAAAIVPVTAAIIDTAVIRLFPQPILLSGLGWFRYFTASAGIYFLTSLLISLALSPLFFITRLLPGLRGKEPKYTHTVFGASFNLIALVIFFEILDKNELNTFTNPLAIIIITLFGILLVTFSVYIVPLAVAKLKAATARPIKTSISIISYACLGAVLLSLSYTFIKPLYKPDYDINAPNLLVISIDTLRKDHVSFYGYDEIATPNLDNFITETTRFDNAFCSSPWTFPSFSSFLTGFEPSVCGVDHTHRLSDNITTFTEILHKEGYNTECYNSNWSMYPEYGFGKGFDIYMDRDTIPYLSPFRGTRLYFHYHRVGKVLRLSGGNHYRYEADFNSNITAASLKNQGERPFFIWCNFFDPHSRYDPPPEYIDGDDSYFDDLVRRAAPAYGAPFDDREIDLEALTILYDGEIAHVDDEIGRILRALEETEHYDDTIVVIFNDHGEAFQEHGLWGHGFDVYPELTDMLLAVRDPFRGNEKPVSNKNVSHIDIMPTILEMLGLDIPEAIQGESFYGELSFADNKSSPVLSEYIMKQPEQIKGIRRDGFLFVRDYSNGNTELYNIDEDPAAINNVSGDFPDIAVSLNLEMEKAVEENKRLFFLYSSENEMELSEADKSRLKSIGYLGN